jgi:hypothetical protein
MPDRSGYIASGILHLGLVLLFVLGLPSLFRHKLPEETPLVVQLVKIGPETRATQVAKTPPVPEAKPEVAEQPPPPKPEPPTPEPPKITPKPEPPKMIEPAAPQLAAPIPPPPPVPAPKPQPQTLAKPVPVPPQKPLPPKPKQDQTQQFDTLLKNLAKNDPTHKTPDQPRPDKPNRQASSQPIAPLGSTLTMSERDAVIAQIERCWSVPAGARDAPDLTPEFRVTMNRDGTVREATLLNNERYGDPYFRAAADSARRALFNPACSPLHLPPDKFDQWQTIDMTFNPKDVLG